MYILLSCRFLENPGGCTFLSVYEKYLNIAGVGKGGREFLEFVCHEENKKCFHPKYLFPVENKLLVLTTDEILNSNSSIFLP